MIKRTKSKEVKLAAQGALVTDIAIGMSEGLTVPFALAAGLSGVVDSSNIILLAGIVAVTAGAVSMGVGGYYAVKSEMKDHAAESKEAYDGSQTPDNKEELKAFFANLGLSEEIQQQAAEEVMKDKEQWTAIITKYETKTDPKQPLTSALHIGLAYIAGGLIPLSPYLFLEKPAEALKISAIITIVSLFVFGWIKSKLTGTNPWAGALRISIIGALAAGAAFLVARFFES